MSEQPTLKELKAMQKLLDAQEVPVQGRVMHYINEETGSVEEIEFDGSVSPREILQKAFPKADL